MKKADRYTGLIILPGGGGKQEPDRMTISDNAENQFIEYWNSRGVPIPEIKEAVRKWNAMADPTNLKEAEMFQRFREIQRKAFGDLG